MNIEGLIQNRIKSAEMRQRDKEPRHRRVKQRDASEIPQTATCGNCTHMTYVGIMEIKLEWGSCEAFKQSERLANRYDTPSCPFWSKRSYTVTINELAFSEEVRRKYSSVAEEVIAKGKRMASAKGNSPEPKPPKVLDPSKPIKKSAKDALTMLGIGIGDKFDDEMTEENDNGDEDDNE